MKETQKIWKAMMLGGTVQGIVSYAIIILLILTKGLVILEFILNYPLISLLVVILLIGSLFWVYWTFFFIGFFTMKRIFDVRF